MELTNYHGVPMVFVDGAEAAETDWHHLRGRAEVVRVEDPPVGIWSALRDRGFVPKPEFVSWLADAADCEEAYLARLTSGERQKIRSARRQLADAGLLVSVRELDRPLLAEFLRLYRDSIGRMRHGVAVAYEEKDEIYAERTRYAAVCVHEGGTLVGCCLARTDATKGLVNVRFSAVDAPYREASMARVLYLKATEVARQLGLPIFSMGKDPNLYGHIAKPGLLRFKRQLGLAPYPSQLIDPTIGHDQADLVLGLDALSDPSMLLGYLDGAAGAATHWPSAHGHAFRLEIFSAQGEADLRPFATKFADARTHLLGRTAEATLG